MVLERPPAGGHRVGWVAAVSTLLGACSLVYSPEPARQCSTNSDCDAEPALSGRRCDAEYGICIQALETDTAPGAPCVSTESCEAANLGQPALCRVPGTPCVRLATRTCPRVSGDWKAPDAVFIGSIGQQTQDALSPQGVPPVSYATHLLDAIDLGVDEWAQSRRAAPSASARSMAVVHCDSAGDAGQAEAAMTHLVDTVRAPLVMTLGDLDLAAVTDRAVETGTALLCIGCYGRSTESSFDQGLIWRLHPALEEQASMVAWRVSDLEERLRRERGLDPSAVLRVALLTQESPGITAFRERARLQLVFNGGSASDNADNFFELPTPGSAREPVDRLQIAQRVAQFQPDIIIVGVASDFTTYYLPMIEDAWTSNNRPYYVATSMNEELGLLEPIVGSNDDLRRRISGTALFAEPRVTANAEAFATRYSSRYGRAAENVQFGYDGLYASAYALVAAESAGRFDGGAMALGLGSLSGSQPIDVGPAAIESGTAYMRSGQSIDLVGSSTALGWHRTLHEVRSDVGLWCLARAANGDLTLRRDAGVRWQTGTGFVVGAFTCD